ncbi:hypothetical protein [Hyalangium gracile]|uniref:hypothetical protein n=1 Tax=Hyalangium gracile TaxID=394092 RepID=UPI001CC9F7E7|nr:hypothetical protein [Hyalangium gracile]
MIKSKFSAFKLPSLQTPSSRGNQHTGAPTAPGLNPGGLNRPGATPRSPQLQDSFGQSRGLPSAGTPSAGPSMWSRMNPSNLFTPSPARQQQAAIKQDAASLQNVPGGFPAPTGLYHATSTAAWNGMSKTGGLVPASMLNQHGIQRVTGEGDQFSKQAGEKDFISFGQGPKGLGTSRAYFQQTANSPSYSPHLYSDAQLSDEIAQSKKLLANWNLPEGRVVGDMVDKPRVEARLRHLEAEQSMRKNMPGRETPYPIMFDFKGDNLNAKPMGMGPGEAAVHGPVMFKDNLQRMFVPADKVKDMQARLDATMGPGHNVQVLSFEGQTKFLEQQKKANGANASNPAYLALREDGVVSSNLNRMESNRQTFYNMAGENLNVPTL